MMINDILLEKFFSNRLSEAELLEFKKRYNTKDTFKQDVDFLQNLQLVSQDEDDADFKSRLGTYETEFSQKKSYSDSGIF